MASKSTKPTAGMPAQGEANEARAKRMAAISLTPVFNAAGVVQSFSIHGELDYFALADQLIDQCKSVERGDLTRVEAMLTAQAHSLDAIFVSLARRAAVNVREYLEVAETCLKLALKAQSQCRATLETLAAIKSPPMVFAKQANIAHGHQQINNTVEPALAHAEQNEKQPNELLECEHGEQLDTRTKGTASESDPAMATVEVIDRPKDRKR